MRETKVYHYDQSTYGVKDFQPFWSKGTPVSHRVDVDFFTRAKSKAEAIRKFMATPAIDQSANWIRERLIESKMRFDMPRSRIDLIMTDDAVYCFTDHDDYMGKYFDGVWHPARIRKYRMGFRGSVGTSFSEGFFQDLLKAVRSGAEDIISAKAIDHDTFEIHTLIREEGES